MLDLFMNFFFVFLPKYRFPTFLKIKFSFKVSFSGNGEIFLNWHLWAETESCLKFYFKKWIRGPKQIFRHPVWLFLGRWVFGLFQYWTASITENDDLHRVWTIYQSNTSIYLTFYITKIDVCQNAIIEKWVSVIENAC